MYKSYFLLMWFVSLGFVSPVYTTPQEESVPLSAEKVSPLPVGVKVPSANVHSPSKALHSIHEVLASKPTVLIFYRGGWCPYCNIHLGRLATIEDELVALGFQIVAISPDRPDKIRQDKEKLKESGVEVNSHYQLYSDSKMELSKAFGSPLK